MGGERGRLINSSDRARAVHLIQKASADGARIIACCDTLDISVRTYQRWNAGDIIDKRKGAKKMIPRKLSVAEEEKLISLCCSKRYQDMNPYEIFVNLLEEGIYVASISTIYRVLRKKNLIHNRSNRKGKKSTSKPPQVIATGPNQIWCWDITWLPSAVKGIFYYAYTIIDIWDRSIIGWVIHPEERDEHSKNLFNSVLAEQNYPNVHIHSDNGSPMKGLSLLALYRDLKISNSYSRPRVSNDNPFIESFFGTMKKSIKYPKAFKSLSDARTWFADFINCYNNEHRHSGIYYCTPNQLRTGVYTEILQKRNHTMFDAYKRNLQRWSSTPKQWNLQHVVYLNPTNELRQILKKSA